MTTPSAFHGHTIAGARRELARRLATAGREPAQLDARHLLQAVTGLTHTGLIRNEAAILAPGAAACLADLAERRLAGEPLSRILGAREFGGLSLDVRPGVLDPREDTEAVVRLALRLCPAPRRVLDLGTGSGALLCALLHAAPGALGVGTDLSQEACSLARRNVERHGFAARALIVRGRWAEALTGPFDLVVSNPPYIPSLEIDRLEPEVRDHDPPLALDGGPDGLDAYRAILGDIARLVAPAAVLVFEIGAGDQSRVETLLAAAGWQSAGLEHDAGGHVRALAARFLPPK